MDVMLKLSEGNPGAATVLMQVMQTASAVDPENAFGPLGPMLSLDTYAIYGSKIWVLYKEVCEQDIVRFLGVLRATQMGIISLKDVNRAIENPSTMNVGSVMVALKERLPSFKWDDDSQGNDGITADLE